MGVVYRARDPIIGRALAIKVVSLSGNLPDEARDEYRQRFFREAQAAGNLHHPNIVTVFDAGEEGGVPYIVMELVEGESLAQRLKRAGKLSIEEASSIARQVAAGLAYAHEKGVVHRDIKPANILLDAKGRAAITDFGVARLSASDLTRTGEVLGTPNFMSPEQVLGHSLDGRSDLFSLGVVYYLMLTGERPFKGEEVSAICYNVVHSEPVPPVSSLSLPGEVAGVLERLLRKSPAERFADGEAAAAALREVTERTQVVASPASAASQRRSAGGSSGVTRPATGGQPATMSAPPRGLGRGAKAALMALAVLAAAGVIVASWRIATRWRGRIASPAGVQASAPKESAPPPATQAPPVPPSTGAPRLTPASSATGPAPGTAAAAAEKARRTPPLAKPIPVGIVAEGPLASGRIRVEAGGKTLLDRPFLGGLGRGRKGLLLADRLLLAPGERKVTIAVVSERPSPFAADTNETVRVPPAGEVTLTVRVQRYPDRLAVALVPTADLPERLAGLLSGVETAPGAPGSVASSASPAAETAHLTLVVEGPLDRGQIVFFVDGRIERVVPILDLPRRQDGTGFRLEVSRELPARTYALGFEVKAPRPFPFFAAARRTVRFQPGESLRLVIHCRRDPARLEVEEEQR